jgi:hypothetical protein
MIAFLLGDLVIGDLRVPVWFLILGLAIGVGTAVEIALDVRRGR